MKPTLGYERKLWKKGYTFLAGVDEVGRGSLAGPLVVAAVIFPKIRTVPLHLAEVNDSKLLSAKKRQILVPLIKRAALDWGFGQATPREIDQLGIVKATQRAMRRAVKYLKRADFLLIDAFHVPYIPGLPRKKQLAIVKGDQRCFSIAAASILAKVYRDQLMVKLSKRYPAYQLDRHKGYGTLLHRRMIKKFGPSSIHRKTFLHG